MTVMRQFVLADLAARIAAIRRPHPVRVAIDGVDAAGKTTLADDLVALIQQHDRPVIRASIDGFHHPEATRRLRGPLSPEGYFFDSFNYPELVQGLLQPLGPGGSRFFRHAVFDFRTDEPVAAPIEQATPDSILLLDGVFLLRQELRDYFDYSVFVRADFEITLARAVQRDLQLFGNVDEVRRRYRERYIPGQELYFRIAEPERRASVILDNNDPERPYIKVPERVT